MGASWMFLFEADAQIGVSIATLAYYCGPVIVMILSPFLFKEKMTAVRLFGSYYTWRFDSHFALGHCKHGHWLLFLIFFDWRPASTDGCHVGLSGAPFCIVLFGCILGRIPGLFTAGRGSSDSRRRSVERIFRLSSPSPSSIPASPWLLIAPARGSILGKKRR
jgi:hypothetical protein